VSNMSLFTHITIMWDLVKLCLCAECWQWLHASYITEYAISPRSNITGYLCHFNNLSLWFCCKEYC